ncbi:MAG: c-type cytochrome [Flaviaesturariibacter sp.]|nr:c-type cytochrome [Flaviaesturariibacter sp.]
MKRTVLTLLVIGSLFAMSFVITRPDPPLYKNLKVLPKNINKEQMDSVMHHFSLSLGVKCNFCHIRNDSTKTWDFASDANKHKLVAREMMKMTEKINDKFFDVSGSKNLNAALMVTCYTCHHGKVEPETKAIERPRSPQPGDSTRRANGPRPDSAKRQ